ncbi:MAG: Do family serine endopeptidase [Candidatus Aminicenantes bacterium]
MKKYAGIALSGFALGLVVAGYLFLHNPEKEPLRADVFAKAPAADLSPNLFASSAPQEKMTLDFVTIAEKMGPAVVRIEAERREASRTFGFQDEWPFGDDFFDRFFGRPRQQPRPESDTVQVGGTGFFISPDGYILTNNHLVEKDKTVKVTISTIQGDEYEAKIVGTDPGTDLALLKIEAKGLPFAEFGDSGLVKVGEWVLAIGNPLGMEHTVTAGIVSYKGRQIDTQSYQDFIQTDAAINRGNSGGPLINMKGEVIGINSNILTSGYAGNIGIGFAIPSSIAKKVVVQLKEKGRVVRGRLGVTIRDLTSGMAKQWKLKSTSGAVVNTVEPGSPAEKAGLQQYDVITHVDGEAVKSGDALRFKIADIMPGTKVDLTVVRDGKEMKMTAVVDELEPEAEKAEAIAPQKDIGISIVALSAPTARRYGLRTTEGLLITEVRPSSEAARQGLRPGMIIIEVNRKRVVTVRDFETILKGTESGEEIILLIRQEAESRTQDFIVTVKVR